MNDESLMKQLTTVAYSWNIYAPLKNAYEQNSKYDRKSKLKECFQEIEKNNCYCSTSITVCDRCKAKKWNEYLCLEPNLHSEIRTNKRAYYQNVKPE